MSVLHVEVSDNPGQRGQFLVVAAGSTPGEIRRR